MDGDHPNMDIKSPYANQQYAFSTNNIPTYGNRRTPSYYVTNEYPTDRGSNMASPRYSPTVQPWRRQQAQSSLSFIPSTSPRPEDCEYTTAQPKRSAERTSPVPVSPFRSVRRMKQPFQLRLPSSPSMESIQSVAREHRASRTFSGTHTLRTWRSDQNLTTTSMETFGLLPSPPLSDTRASEHSPSSAYFSPKIDSDLDTEQGTPKSSVYTPTTVASEMCHTTRNDKNVQDGATEATNVHMAHSNLMKQCESDDGKFTPVSVSSERMSSPAASSDIEGFGKSEGSGSSQGTERSRSGTVSSEGSWVPSSLSYCETWLQGAPAEVETTGQRSKEINRRKFQIVQKSPPPPERRREVKSKPVIFAVASRTKPKLVDISRQSSPAMSSSISTPPQHPIPSTPDQREHEISAFSPDTPLEMSDSGYATTDFCTNSTDDFSEEKENEAVTTNSKQPATVNERDKPETTPSSQFAPKPAPKLDRTPKANTSPKPHASGRSSRMSDNGELKKWWDHEWTIDQLEHSIKSFPRNMLRLTSPVIMFIRHCDEKALLRRFRQIFPDAAENLLDSLCAVLIARNHVFSLATSKRKTAFHGHRPNLSRLDTVPEKTNSMLGIHFSQPSPSRIRNQVLGSRIGELNKVLDGIVDDLLLAICGKKEETLKSAVLVLTQVLETKP
ncbi:hypothetical protein BDV25DRAFT_171022 [Aspergillus avenaceus]|uniref:Uncharacterized protein n=1 Tax=Aspergillus avenaceus TaxID=36643 RepID=A0A5N6TZU7_ASPAV|nr:hypothetical protein BDV25DRAFT_171022 [Aspergillus avenaceus]